MKTTQLSLCLILFSIYTNPLLCGAANEATPVVDINGNQLLAGVDYYVLPVIRGRGGGLTLASTGNKTCPLDVVQEQLEVETGLPLTFRPVNPKERTVHVSADQNIKFSASSTCVQSTVWTLDYDDSFQKYIITTGGVEGNPGRQTLSNWFRIDEYASDYKLVFCPGVCNNCRPVCGDVSIFVQDGQRRLTLSLTDGAAFRVMFKKSST